MANLPTFVSRWGPGALHPIVCRGVDAYFFLLEGDADRLRGLCDRYLNQPAAGAVEYQPLTHTVILNFERAQRLAPRDPPASERLALTETEASLWVLTAAMRRLEGIPVVDHLAWFVPYIFVGEWPAIMGGREVYGFPKEQAWFEMPSDPAQASHFSVDVYGIPSFGPQAQFDRQRLLDLDLAPGSSPGMAPIEAGDALDAFRRLVLDRLLIPSPTLPLTLLEELANREGVLVFLKQLYAAEDGTRACYQAIIEAPIRVLGTPVMHRLEGTYQLTCQALDTHPLNAELGLTAQQVLGGYAVAMDYEIDNGRTLWQAP